MVQLSEAYRDLLSVGSQALSAQELRQMLQSQDPFAATVNAITDDPKAGTKLRLRESLEKLEGFVQNHAEPEKIRSELLEVLSEVVRTRPDVRERNNALPQIFTVFDGEGSGYDPVPFALIRGDRVLLALRTARTGLFSTGFDHDSHGRKVRYAFPNSEHVGNFSPDSPIEHIAADSRHRVVLAATWNALFAWDGRTGDLSGVHSTKDGGRILGIDVAEGDRFFAFVSGSGSEQLIQVWQVVSGHNGKINEPVSEFTVPAGMSRVSNIRFSPDGQTLLATDTHAGVALFRVSDGTLLRFDGGRLESDHSSAVSPDLDVVAFASPSEREVLVRELWTGRETSFKTTDNDHVRGALVQRLVFSPEATRLIALSSKRAWVFDVREENLRTISLPWESFGGAALPDRSTLLVSVPPATIYRIQLPR